jgi:hypothetical protein
VVSPLISPQTHKPKLSMFSLILLSLAVVFVMIFAFVLLIDESSQSKLLKSDVKDMMSFEKNWTLPIIFMKLGPILIGTGIIGLLMSQFWASSLNKLIILGLFTLLLFLLTYLQKTFSTKEKNSQLVMDILVIFDFFSIGGVLFALNEYIFDSRWVGINLQQTKSVLEHSLFLMGTTELMTIWVMVALVIAYFSRSSIMMIFASLLNGLFFLNYYFNEVNIIRDVFRYEYKSLLIPFHINYVSCFIPPFLLASIFPFLYAYHQQKSHENGDIRDRIFYHLSALMSYFSIGGLIVYSLWQLPNKEFIVSSFMRFENQSLSFLQGSMNINILVVVASLIVFGIDQFLKTKKSYNLNITAGITVFICGILGFLINPNLAFLGFYILPIPYSIWLLADFLRQKSKIAMILFYIYNSMLLWVLLIDRSRFDSLIIFLLLGIMFYAGRLHKTNRLYNFYTIVTIIFSIIIFVFGVTMYSFSTMIIAGVLASLYGYISYRNSVPSSPAEIR